MKYLLLFSGILLPLLLNAQVHWINVDSIYQRLSANVHVYKTTDPVDGGGSSCLLVNGKETNTPCDKTGQRPVPAVFMVKKR